MSEIHRIDPSSYTALHLAASGPSGSRSLTPEELASLREAVPTAWRGRALDALLALRGDAALTRRTLNLARLPRGSGKVVRDLLAVQEEREQRRRIQDPLISAKDQRQRSAARRKERRQQPIREAVLAAYHQCRYRRAQASYVGGHHSVTVRVVDSVDSVGVTSETDRVWHHRHAWSGTDSSHTIRVASDWLETVPAPVHEGRLVLRLEGDRALVVKQGRGTSLVECWVPTGSTRKLPPETIKARKLGLRIAEVRRQARERGVSTDAVLDSWSRSNSLAVCAEKVWEVAQRLGVSTDVVMDRLAGLRAAAHRPAAVVRRIMTRFPHLSAIDLALLALEAENCRAQRVSRAERERIYDAKDSLIGALLRLGMGTVYSFDWDSVGRYGTCCTGVPIRADEECFSCGCEVEGEKRTQTWYLVTFQAERYRFHVPPWSSECVHGSNAQPMEPHDPSAVRRRVPATGLTSEEHLTLITYVASLNEMEILSCSAH